MNHVGFCTPYSEWEVAVNACVPDPYRTIVLLDTYPAHVLGDWINLHEDIAGISVIAFVVPFERVPRGGSLFFNGKPIVTWEDPGTERRRAEQYLTLYRVTQAESLIDLGWPYTIPCANPEEYARMVTLPKVLYSVMSGITLSRVIHKKLYGDFRRREDGRPF